ncbi:hypothetical protein BGZ68_009206 [Mortierella alpina]|nr:hypothetical protein BGZ68_009206 [Mortierella alpina]
MSQLDLLHFFLAADGEGKGDSGGDTDDNPTQDGTPEEYCDGFMARARDLSEDFNVVLDEISLPENAPALDAVLAGVKCAENKLLEELKADGKHIDPMPLRQLVDLLNLFVKNGFLSNDTDTVQAGNMVKLSFQQSFTGTATMPRK